MKAYYMEPSDVPASQTFASMNDLEDQATTLLNALPTYDTEQLWQAGEQAVRYERVAWRIRCAVIFEIYQRAIAIGGAKAGAQAIGQMVQRFGLDRATIYKDIDLQRTFGSTDFWVAEVTTDPLSKGHYIEALSAAEPETALNALRQRADRGGLTRTEARQVVRSLQRTPTSIAPTHSLIIADPPWEQVGNPYHDLKEAPVEDYTAVDATVILHTPIQHMFAVYNLLHRWDLHAQTVWIETAHGQTITDALIWCKHGDGHPGLQNIQPIVYQHGHRVPQVQEALSKVDLTALVLGHNHHVWNCSLFKQ